ncbi:DoxX family membrane protein [Paenibacillus antarcticus]|nr:DoxX family membrane protein [Paenibacillus antarcticus]
MAMLHYLIPSHLYLHVKWFIADDGWISKPLTKILTPDFIFWLCITLLVLLFATIINKEIERNIFVSKILDFLNRFNPYQLLIFRVGVGLGLMLQLCTGSYLAPTFLIDSWWVYVLLIVAIIGLFHRRLLPVSGFAIAFLYLNSALQYGLFHALDYFFYVGIIYYLFAVNNRFKVSSIRVLYTLTGISLAWLSMEKMTMPGLTQTLIYEYKLPTLGFSTEEFVLIAAFIELALGWVLILGIMNRFTALLLTGIFLTTTTVFGFTEVVGHWIIHTLLLMFLIEGKGAPSALYQFHQPMWLRCLFVVVNFCMLLICLMALFIWIQQF